MSLLKLSPAVKDYIWGGTKLRDDFDIQADTAILAEAWVLSCHGDGPSIIKGGRFDGRTLDDVIKNEGKAFIGTKGEKFDFFPVLVKLIDAKDNLSVQVHPSDEYALKNENQYGKTEAWYIIDCDEGAQLIYGLNKSMTRSQLRQCIENGTLLDNVNRVNVKKGDMFFIPSGTIHAIGKGILLAEVQQNSNVTYRVYDYGRLQNGKPRELHIDKAVDVINLNPPPVCSDPMGKTVQKEGYKSTLLTKCELFCLTRLDIEEKAEITVDETSFVSLTSIDGNGVVRSGDSCKTLYKGETVFVPANTGKVEILGAVTVLDVRL